jgi:hypothetical protein
MIKRISPECGIAACPAVYEKENGDLLIVGKMLTVNELIEASPFVKASLIDGESVVCVPKALIADLKF